jgi:hypothetical protein
MQRVFVILRVDSHGADAELRGGTKDADGDLATVGNQ